MACCLVFDCNQPAGNCSKQCPPLSSYCRHPLDNKPRRVGCPGVPSVSSPHPSCFHPRFPLSFQMWFTFGLPLAVGRFPQLLHGHVWSGPPLWADVMQWCALAHLIEDLPTLADLAAAALAPTHTHAHTLSLYIYIYIHMLDGRQRVHLTPSQKASSGSTKNKKKKRFFLQVWKWDMNVVPELAPLWSPNRLSNWSFLTSLILLENPIFIVCSYTFLFKMLNLRHNFGQNFRPSKNQFELLSGCFVDPELPFKISPRIQAKKKKKTPQKNDNNAKPKRFFLQKGAFSGKKEENFDFFCPWSVGLSVAKGL